MRLFVEIDTLWNVKDLYINYMRYVLSVEIDTLWNVKLYRFGKALHRS